MADIRLATLADIPLLIAHDTHVRATDLARIIPLGHVLMAYEGDRFTGWLRYGLFWDEIPCAHMLFVLEADRGRGIGRMLMADMETRARVNGRKRLLVTTQVDESAQHFYRKLGYRDAGVLLLPEQAAELLMIKDIG